MITNCAIMALDPTTAAWIMIGMTGLAVFEAFLFVAVCFSVCWRRV